MRGYNNDSGSGGSSRGMGWLIWIGIIIGVNVLSYVFHWGFWLY